MRWKRQFLWTCHVQYDFFWVPIFAGIALFLLGANQRAKHSMGQKWILYEGDFPSCGCTQKRLNCQTSSKSNPVFSMSRLVGLEIKWLGSQMYLHPLLSGKWFPVTPRLLRCFPKKKTQFQNVPCAFTPKKRGAMFRPMSHRFHWIRTCLPSMRSICVTCVCWGMCRCLA